MKKTYTKPQIVYDCFEIADSIAAGCKYFNTNQAPYICPIFDPESEFTIFSDYINCAMTPPHGNDSICYHIPVNDWNVYMS